LKEKALSRAGLHDLRLTFSPAWLRNFVAACGLARSTAAYGGLRRRLCGLSIELIDICLRSIVKGRLDRFRGLLPITHSRGSMRVL